MEHFNQNKAPHPSNGYYTEGQLFKRLYKDFSGNTLQDKFSEEWILDLHISNVVKISNLEQFIEKLNNQIFSEEIVIKMIMVFACCVFSIAAENRFISHSEINN